MRTAKKVNSKYIDINQIEKAARKDSVENIIATEKRSLSKIGHKLPKLSGLKISKISSHISLNGQIASRMKATKKPTGNLAQGTNADLLNPDKTDSEQTHVPESEQSNSIKPPKRSKEWQSAIFKGKEPKSKDIKSDSQAEIYGG